MHAEKWRKAMPEIDYAKMGMRIRQIRKAKGWSQEEFAKKCSISVAFAGHIERGTRSMSLETFVGVCEVLGVNADELLWGIPQSSQAVVKDFWRHHDKKDDDSYAMYIRIIKSVADIMSER